MTTSLELPDTALRVDHELPLSTGPILVATDGDESCDAALRAARVMRGASASKPELVSVVEPLVVGAEEALLGVASATYWKERRDAQLVAVRAQLARTVAPECDWPVTILEGRAPETLARHAHLRGAQLILTGRGRHGFASRALGGESVLGVVRHGDTPVLAVEGRLSHAPSRIVIATDFSEFSTYAARVALSLAAPDAVVHLVHVPFQLRVPLPSLARLEQQFADAVPDELEKVRHRIDPRGEREIALISLPGNPARRLVAYALTMSADLLVCATHGHGFIDRLLLGSVATDLLRRAPCSVLCVPGSAATHAWARLHASMLLRPVSLDSGAWPDELAKIKVALAGRPCVLEAGDREGMDILASRLRLRDTEYEPRESVVRLFFGGDSAEESHLAHVIRNVRGIDRLLNPGGALAGLQILTTQGQTRLRTLP